MERSFRGPASAEEGGSCAGCWRPCADQDLVAPLHHSPAVRRSDVQRLQWSEACSRFSERRRSEEHTSELQSLMRISYAVFCLKKKKQIMILRSQSSKQY